MKIMFDHKNFIKQSILNDFKESKSFLTDKKTVCVKHRDGRISKYFNISDPWKYIAKVKKEMDVEKAWIED